MRTVQRFAALLLAAGTTAVSVHAASVTKAATGGISSASSWVGGVLPGSSDIAVFDGTTTVTNSSGATFDASGNSTTETWGGMQVTDIHGPLAFTNVATLTIGSGGIDMSAATADVTFTGSTNYVRLSAEQTFTIASGRTLTLGNMSTSGNIYTLTITGGGTLAVTGTATGSGSNRLSFNVTGTGTTLGGTGTYKPNNTSNTGWGGVQIGSGAFIAPGTGTGSIGTLTFDSSGTTQTLLTMDSGAGFKFDLGAAGSSFEAPGTSDVISITSAAVGDVVFNNNTIDLLGGGQAGVYQLFKSDLNTVGSSTWSGLTLSGQTIVSGLAITDLADGLVGTLYVGDGTNGTLDDIYLEVAAIPEPATCAVFLGVAGVAFAAWRRRRRA